MQGTVYANHGSVFHGNSRMEAFTEISERWRSGQVGIGLLRISHDNSEGLEGLERWLSCVLVTFSSVVIKYHNSGNLSLFGLIICGGLKRNSPIDS